MHFILLAPEQKECHLWIFFFFILQVIIDSQPLTVAILANLLFGESIGIVGASGLVLGVIGLLLLEVNTSLLLTLMQVT
jgi:drug/metabolite transporter (DMT)-like permease